MARFYGWLPQEIEELSLDQVGQYQSGMEQIEAQEALLNISVTHFSEMKANDRDKLHRQLFTRGYPKETDGKPLTLARMAEFMGKYGR